MGVTYQVENTLKAVILYMTGRGLISTLIYAKVEKPTRINKFGGTDFFIFLVLNS